MKLQIFDRSTSSLKSNRISYRAVSFNRRNARATFQKQAPRSMARAILDSLKAKSGACLLISQNPVIIEGEEWYELITTKPIRIQ